MLHSYYAFTYKSNIGFDLYLQSQLAPAIGEEEGISASSGSDLPPLLRDAPVGTPTPQAPGVSQLLDLVCNFPKAFINGVMGTLPR